MNSLSVKSKIWPGIAGCAIIAEVAQAHDGSLGMAHAYIDTAAAAGANGIKFQTHIAEAESTPSEPWRVRFSPQDETRYDYWKRMEFSEDQWAGLRAHAETKGLLFISSAFSPAAVDLLARVGMDAWKVASGEVENLALVEKMARTKWPFLVSTGMSDWREIDTAVNHLKSLGAEYALLQCTSMYPTPAERLGLNVIEEFRSRYRCPVGLSDHSGKTYAGLAAAAIGIDVLEVHLTLSRHMFGPDVTSSVDPDELRQLVEGVRFIEMARAHPVDKTAIADELREVRRIFQKKVVAARDLPEGTVIGEKDVALKKSAEGLTSSSLNSMLGRRLKRSLKRDEALLDGDLA